MKTKPTNSQIAKHEAPTTPAGARQSTRIKLKKLAESKATSSENLLELEPKPSTSKSAALQNKNMTPVAIEESSNPTRAKLRPRQKRKTSSSSSSTAAAATPSSSSSAPKRRKRQSQSNSNTNNIGNNNENENQSIESEQSECENDHDDEYNENNEPIITIKRYVDSSTSVWIEKSILNSKNVVEMKVDLNTQNVQIRSWPAGTENGGTGGGANSVPQPRCPPEQPRTPPQTRVAVNHVHIYNIDDQNGAGVGSMTTSGGYEDSNHSSSIPVITEADMTDDEDSTIVDSYYEPFHPRRVCNIQ